MCTVTFCPSEEGWLLTSSRDVKYSRAKASFPTQKTANKILALYPEDGLAKGTWIGVNSIGLTVCLLNGAFVKHKSTGNYVKSRGQIVLELLTTDAPKNYLSVSILEGIEPFTLVFIYKECLLEYRWDGMSLHKKHLDIKQKHLWSSVTLYSEQTIAQRQKLFRQWVQPKKLTEKECIAYHRIAFEELGPENSALMSRPEEDYGTVSLSCIKASKEKKTFFYQDLIHHSSELVQCPNEHALENNEEQ